MKRMIALLLLLSSTTLTGCDIPAVDFYERNYELPASGGEMIIPVNSTGLDDVEIRGDEDWLTIVEVIDQYDMTRALAEWDSGIKIRFEPNNTGKRRSARIVAISFGADDRVGVRQPSL